MSACIRACVCVCVCLESRTDCPCVTVCDVVCFGVVCVVSLNVLYIFVN